MADGDPQLDALLARGRLSGPARERVLDGVMAATPQPRRRRWPVATLAALAAAAVVLLMMGRDGFRPRGDSGTLLEVACGNGSSERCPTGELLLFRLSGVERTAWLGAWAERGGERVWYFPTAGGESPKIEPQAGPQVLSQGVRLGPSQPAGTWEIKLFLFASPPTRESMATATPLSSATRRIEVTP